MSAPNITFWPNTTRIEVASYRIRCALVRRALAGLGVETRLAVTDPGEPDVLVLSKRADAASLARAIAVKERHGTRLVLDLCDNPWFLATPDDPAARDRLRAFDAALDRFDAIVTPSDHLRAEAAAHVRADMRFERIPDAVEPRPAPGFFRRLRETPAFLALEGLRKAILAADVAEGRRLLWFGISGTRKANNGLRDLAAFLDRLAHHDAIRPISLTVISDSRARFREIAAGQGFACLYLPWNHWTFHAACRFHDIAILPVRRNDYNWSKSANRLTAAFDNGLAVAATGIPSYQPFRRMAVLDDWTEGLGQLMADAPDRARRIAEARQLIAAAYAPVPVALLWAALLSDLAGHPLGPRR